MADKKDSTDLLEKGIELAKQVFDTLWSGNGSHDLWHWILLIAVTVVAVGVVAVLVFKTLGTVVEALAKLAEAYKSSGLPLWLSKDNKSRVRRRKQFSAVLDADLAYLAKAESWNDQYFTDLEAEVETEGGYYASALGRLRGRKSFGLRKERSLIRATSFSAERAMQLVGEAGSGKSVALRHLAKQLAEQGRKSNDKNAIVPLYVNLREFDIPAATPVTVDAVRNFVLDNIRRGDADTSAFVKENWDDYCSRGIWLFLFDSFDEIPAVLHAEAGSGVIRQYSHAIRQFLEGMGECKGILASREFKGPEALPWKKLRILPLSGEKQDELISNSFLNAEHMSLVRQHLANSDSSIGATPLFLTLLCRYVREEQRAPTNDHDILMMHVERLARRDPDYLRRQYQLNVAQLLDGAERLARLFAEDSTLSLAPTLDQIVAHLQAEQIPGGSIERLVSALVDCKIGRADVPNAASGDRRFAFAHRRYQEALFVRYLARHPDALSPLELLTEPRWREYTVTLLQTQSLEEMRGLLETARVLLVDCAARQVASIAQAPIPSHIAFFSWRADPAVPLLGLLQEGLARRVKEVPPELSDAVNNFLRPRWMQGDTWDRCEVLRLGGLLPQAVLVDCLAESFDNGTRVERAHAFRQAVFVSQLPESAREAVLKTLSDQILLARDRASQLNLEALAARLPTDIGAQFVVARCSRLRGRVRWMNWIGRIVLPIGPLADLIPRALSLTDTMIIQIQHRETKQTLMFSGGLFVLLAMLLGAWAPFLMEFGGMSNAIRLAAMPPLGLATLGYLWVLCPFLVRSHGGEIKLSDVQSWMYRRAFRLPTVAVVAIGSLICLLLIGLAWMLGYATDWLLHGRFGEDLLAIAHPQFWDRVKLGGITGVITFYAGLLPFAVWTARGARVRSAIRRKRLLRLQAAGGSDVTVLFSASNAEELIGWLGTESALLTRMAPIRGFSSFVHDAMRTVSAASSFSPLPNCLRSDGDTTFKVRTLRQILEDRFELAVAGGQSPG